MKSPLGIRASRYFSKPSQYPQYLTVSFRHILVELTVSEETIRLLHCINNYNHKRSCSIGPYERFVEKYSLFCKLECFIFVKILFHCPKMAYFSRPIPRFLLYDRLMVTFKSADTFLWVFVILSIFLLLCKQFFPGPVL